MIALNYLLTHLLVTCIETKDFLPFALQNIKKNFFSSNKESEIINADLKVKIVENLLLKSCKDKEVSYKIRNLEDIRGRVVLTTSAILIFDSLKTLKSFNKQAVLKNNYSKPFQFYVHVRDSTVDKISSLMETTILRFQYFLIEDADNIKLMTFVWYSPQMCKVPRLMEVDEFKKQTEKRKTQSSKLKSLKTAASSCSVFLICFRRQHSKWMMKEWR